MPGGTSADVPGTFSDVLGTQLVSKGRSCSSWPVAAFCPTRRAYAASVEFNRLGSLSGMVVSVAVLAVAAILVLVVRAAVLAVG